MVEYINYYTKIKIICKEHGQFEQTSNNHLQGTRCPKCFGNKKKTIDEFIIEARKIHLNRYDYSNNI
jgi:Zn finger protein HypA/HybF involved in hydrogenase expression